MMATRNLIAGNSRGYGQLNGVNIIDTRIGLVVGVAIGDVPELRAEVDATAKLWAAAPDLLAALTDAERLFEHTFAMNGTIHKAMKAAIAKATATPATRDASAESGRA